MDGTPTFLSLSSTRSHHPFDPPFIIDVCIIFLILPSSFPLLSLVLFPLYSFLFIPPLSTHYLRILLGICHPVFLVMWRTFGPLHRRHAPTKRTLLLKHEAFIIPLSLFLAVL
ncbi:hypothetical protein CPB84DRAFT_1786708 [Gymnopilus junonius]|uniref:Uncharacterized protein n=1 Tax=Gymnopilus junonius TaxID=109634 RepID=A0A9P5TL15_GYMJU|nr:hypothetical protein CPB84DRAFT_1786708 [Gymnopilus junonius]